MSLGGGSVTRLRSIITAAILIFGFCSAAQAGKITYDFTGGGANGLTVSLTRNGVTLLATGEAGFANPAIIDWDTNGLGVASAGGNPLINSITGSFEGIEFTLPGEATWVSVGITRLTGTQFDFEQALICPQDMIFGGCTDFAIPVDGVTGIDPRITNVSGFAFAPVLEVFSPYGDFRVSSISINVPEPGTFALLGAALVGLGFGQRRRRLAK